MGDKLWVIWMFVAAVFVVAEIFTMGFFLLWFGIGAAVAGLIALLGLKLGWQLACFVVASGILVAASRPFAEKLTKKQPPGIGADRFVGQRGVVLEAIDNIRNTGRIRIGKEEWRADSESGDEIPEGTSVVVSRLEGTRVIVKPL